MIVHLVARFREADGVLRAVLTEAIRDETFSQRALYLWERFRALLLPRRAEMQIPDFGESFDIAFPTVSLEQQLLLSGLRHDAVAQESRNLLRELSIAVQRILGVVPMDHETRP